MCGRLNPQIPLKATLESEMLQILTTTQGVWDSVGGYWVY